MRLKRESEVIYMQLKKSFMALLMVLCLSVLSMESVLAADQDAVEETYNVAEVTTMSVDDFVSSLSETELEAFSDVDLLAFLNSLSDSELQAFEAAVNSGVMPLLDEGSVTVYYSGGSNQNGTFSLSNPGFPLKKTYISFDLITNRSEDVSTMTAVCGQATVGPCTVTKGNSPVHGDFSNFPAYSSSTIVVQYGAHFHATSYSKDSMTLKCWAWVL